MCRKWHTMRMLGPQRQSNCPKQTVEANLTATRGIRYYERNGTGDAGWIQEEVGVAMRMKSGLSFADVLILIAIILLLIALAVPLFYKSHELTREEITGVAAGNTMEAVSNAVVDVSTSVTRRVSGGTQ